MPVRNNEKHLSTVNDDIYVEDLLRNDVRHRTHSWAIAPRINLDETHQQSHTKKFRTLHESRPAMAHSKSSSSSSPHKEQHQTDLTDISDILQSLQTIRAILLALNPSDTHSATEFSKDISMIITDLLLRVIYQIGQTNVHTPTLESIIAYIRNLSDARSEHMRQSIPGPLLMAWYDLSHLMAFMQNEPEIRVTVKKAKQLIDVAFDTASWVYKHLTTEFLNLEHIGYKDRSSIGYTYE